MEERLETAANKYRNVDFSLLVNVNVIEQAEKQNGIHKQIERYENECEILAGRTDWILLENVWLVWAAAGVISNAAAAVACIIKSAMQVQKKKKKK